MFCFALLAWPVPVCIVNSDITRMRKSWLKIVVSLICARQCTWIEYQKHIAHDVNCGMKSQMVQTFTFDRWFVIVCGWNGSFIYTIWRATEWLLIRKYSRTVDVCVNRHPEKKQNADLVWSARQKWIKNISNYSFAHPEWQPFNISFPINIIQNHIAVKTVHTAGLHLQISN